MNNSASPHISVLLNESISGLGLNPGDIAVDCTLGAGGHTAAMLDRVGENGLVVSLDRDPYAIELVKKTHASAIAAGRLRLAHARFSSIEEVAKKEGIFGKIQGILADIGVSSMHLDEAERGFSFQSDGPLDMRMDPSTGTAAADLVNEASQEELSKIFWELGEEPQSRYIARKITEFREQQKITTTNQLAELVKRSVRYNQKSKKHPATKVFQALRIAVNDELGELEELLTNSLSALKSNGRLGVISFHSLEDRIIKNRFIEWSGKNQRIRLPKGIPLTEQQINQMNQTIGNIIKPFPITPTEDEIANNPRSRSAKLRIFAKN